ncbi:uncharacterized protein LOC143222103 isoform X2 [Tachypleus tridentatus]|uniref:uncharacterized protein LOC143222103 isoform X2 n=1 Tax=Tachypleus tridentatus TaxID=6853 RepID=UPI003FD4D456
MSLRTVVSPNISSVLNVDEEKLYKQSETVKSIRPLFIMQSVLGILSLKDWKDHFVVNSKYVVLLSKIWSLFCMGIILLGIVVASFRFRITENAPIRLQKIITAVELPIFMSLCLFFRIIYRYKGKKIVLAVKTLCHVEDQLSSFDCNRLIGSFTRSVVIIVLAVCMACVAIILYATTLYSVHWLTFKSVAEFWSDLTSVIFCLKELPKTSAALVGFFMSFIIFLCEGTMAMTEATLTIVSMILNEQLKQVKKLLDQPSPFPSEKVEKIIQIHWLLVKATDQLNDGLTLVIVGLFCRGLMISFGLFYAVLFTVTQESGVVYITLYCFLIILRILISSFFVAEISRNSHSLIPLVHHIVSEENRKKVNQLIRQANNCTIQLTGGDFFAVTRGSIATVRILFLWLLRYPT